MKITLVIGAYTLRSTGVPRQSHDAEDQELPKDGSIEFSLELC